MNTESTSMSDNQEGFLDTAPPSDNDALLSISNLWIDGYSDHAWHEIVRGANLTLKRGEILGLIGESGAGKSTLGLAAMGFARPGCRLREGSIEFDGIDLFHAKESEKRTLWGSRIAYVAQSAAAAFNPAHTLLDQTIESATMHSIRSADEARKDAIELYRLMQLPDHENFGNRYPHQVSGGQLQRAMTAMAMTSRPDLIIFDEPTTALDVTTQVSVLASIKKIVKDFNTAAIYITHDLAVVAQMADRIKVLRYGKTVEEADTNTMLNSPQKAYTKSLWAVRSISKPVEETDELILQINNISASYSAKGPDVLTDVSINVARGTTVAIVGESGSGKSTTARVITGLLPPKSGQVLFNGELLPEALAGRSKEQLQKIQMIYQSADTAMNPRQKIKDIIGRPVAFYQKLNKRQVNNEVSSLLKLIELDDSFMDRLPSELSGGQKQRICIARALAAKPDVIICDEVTSALDQLVQEGILKLLLKLQKNLGMSYVFITHDIAVVKAIADQIVVMHKGQVVEQGLKHDILTPPHPAYTKLLLSSVPEMDPQWLDNLLASKTFLDAQ